MFSAALKGIAKSTLIAFLFAASSLWSYASDTEFSASLLNGITRRVWRMQDGLPDQTVSALAETSDHYLWLGTPRNLVRFDGWHFVDVSSEIGPEIHDFGVTCLFAAQDGTLWIGTGGARILHVTRGIVHKYGTESGLGPYNVRVLQQDASGRIWAGTDHGIYRLDNGHFHRIGHNGDPSVHAMISDGNGGLWIGGHRLLHYSSGSLQEIAMPKQKVPARIEALARTSDGTLWIGTLGGLLRLEQRSSASPKIVSAHAVRSLLIDNHHRLWVGTSEGGLFIQQGSGTFTHFSEATELVSETVNALLRDDTNDIWLGTRSGLVRLSDTGMHLTPLDEVRSAEHSSLTLDDDGSVWICAGEVIHIVKGKIDRPRLPVLEGVPVRAMLRDRSGALWIGTSGQGVIRIPRKGSAERYASRVGTSYITGFIQGEKDDVWIATESGVALWHSGEIVSFQHVNGAPHQPVLSIATAPDGAWIGTAHGLFRLRNGAFVPDTAISQLGPHAVRALHGSADGTLWMGTEQGLYRWKDGHLVQVPLGRHDHSSAILSIFEDAQGTLWLSGTGSVSRLQRVAINQFLETDGRKLMATEISAVLKETGAALEGGMQASVSDDHGGAWYMSDLGLLHINESERRSAGTAPPVVLEQVLVDGASVQTDKDLILSPSTKTLEIRATPVVLGSRTGLEIRRRLIGFDKNWSPLPSSQTATYTNLPPGRYTYRVEAQWPNSENVSAIELHIIQKAHVYFRAWFLLLCVGMIVLAAWLFHRLKISRVAAQFRAVAEERTRMAREMHDTLLQGCIGISSLLEGIASTQDLQEQSSSEAQLQQSWTPALNLARTEMEKTIREARAAIWNLRCRETEAHLDRALRELLETMTATLPIRTNFQTSGPSVPILPNQHREVLMAAREALQNSIKHAKPGTISLNVRYSPKLVTIEVADDGCGISPDSSSSDRDGHFGVVGMRERMEEVGGRCRIRSTEDSGTTITFELPIAASKAESG